MSRIACPCAAPRPATPVRRRAPAATLGAALAGALALGLPAGAAPATAGPAAAAVAAAGPAPDAGRVDRADIDRTTITGHQELPKVLYIVPWKKTRPDAGLPRPRGGVLDDPAQPLDRDEFRRRLRYHDQIRSTPAPQEKTP